MNTYVPSEARLGSKEAVLVGVEATREIQVINVNGLASTFTYGGNNQIEFSWTSSESNDFANSYFEADLRLNLANGNYDDNASLNNFADMIDRVELYIDSQQVFSTTSREISLIQNLLLMNEGSKSYLENEGKVHLGFNSQQINNVIGAGELTKFDPNASLGADANARRAAALTHAQFARFAGRGQLGAVAADSTRIHIPFFALHMALGSMDGYLPVLGSQLRMILHLNDPKRCMSYGTDTGSHYQLTQCRLFVQEVILSADYKASLMEQVSSPEGLSIHYWDVDVIAMSPVATATSHQFIVRNDHSNAKSLYFFDVDGAAAIPTPATDVPRAYPSMRSRLGTIATTVRVESGNRLFTGINGSVGTMAHYNHLLRTAGHLADISADCGCLSNHYFRVGTGDIAANASRVFAPLGFNLEKATLKDTDSTIINAGLSATDPFVSRDIDVRIETGAVAWDANWRLYAVLLHSKTLVFSNKTISVVD